MANPLTGGYEQSCRSLYGRSMHSRHHPPKRSDTRSCAEATAQYGHAYWRPSAQISRCWGVWGLAYRISKGRSRSRSRRDSHSAHCLDASGAAQMLTDAFAKFDQNWEVELPPECGARLGKFQYRLSTSAFPAAHRPSHCARRASAHTTILTQAYNFARARSRRSADRLRRAQGAIPLRNAVG